MAIASSTPTPERLAHGPVAPPRVDDAHFRQYWRICDRIETLCGAGLISPRELRAAQAFRAIHERAHAGPGGLRAANFAAVRLGKHCGKPSERTAAQAEALARLHRVKMALGALYDLLEMAVIEEMPWTAIGKRLHIDQRTARKWGCAAIAGLAAL